MSPYRSNPVTGRASIVAPVRRGRPNDFLAAANHACPFCPGNESTLESVVETMPAADGAGWLARAVANRFPIVAPPDGRHEVIVETPCHDRDLADLDDAARLAVVELYRRRFAALAADPATAAVILFRNRGLRSGASLAHPHAQIIALRRTPPETARRDRLARAHRRRTGRCLLCALVAAERSHGARIVEDGGAFVAVVPERAEAPCETWIVPARHGGNFGALDPADLAAFADLLGRSLRRLRGARGDPDYNLMLIAPPRPAVDRADAHWLARILPRTGGPAGFEIAAGLAVYASTAEADAALLAAQPAG
jgi:UDPglucose--hexose-1-phosphate uridylyltransferase